MSLLEIDSHHFWYLVLIETAFFCYRIFLV